MERLGIRGRRWRSHSRALARPSWGSRCLEEGAGASSATEDASRRLRRWGPWLGLLLLFAAPFGCLDGHGTLRQESDGAQAQATGGSDTNHGQFKMMDGRDE